MKKVFYTALFVIISLAVNAQDTKWNIGFGGGFSSPQSDLKKLVDGGINGYLNCTYNFMPKLAAGLEYNSAVLIGIKDKTSNVDIKATTITGYLLKGVFYMTETSVRPYVSAMAGMYKTEIGIIATDEYGNDISDYISKNKIGGGLELGLKIKWFNLGVGYHNIGKIEEAKISYLQYNLGFNVSF